MNRYLNNIMRRLTVASIAGLTALGASAFSSSKYATTSQLASGKWVKIAVAADGVYEITAQELQQMGFSNINNVHVYGNGGHMISEILDGSAIDDITQVASQVIGDKLYFYGKGPVGMTAPINASLPTFTRTINAYSTLGYYFLTEGGESVTVETVSTASQGSGSTATSTSLDYFYHEVDSYSYGHSGKDMLGEDITQGNKVSFTLPQVADNTVTVSITAGAKTVNAAATLGATITPTGGTSTSISFSSSAASISKPIKTYNYYNTCSPVASVTTSQLPSSGEIALTLTPGSGGTVSQGNLDNIIITYTRNNVIDDTQNGQVRMTYLSLSDNMVVLPGANEDIVVWRLDDTNVPVCYETREVDNGYGFSPADTSSPSFWVAFDPGTTLMKISSYEEVPAQNLHGMSTPDMLIITNKTFLTQAQRIVDMHKLVDDLEITVVDQEHIFNEFSSGTPDAMAYRLLCKMLYDRDNTKFKYLLLLGEGSYDNRGLTSNKKNRIITYETDVSNNEDYSYCTDDFFGFLDDNSGSKVSSEMLRLGVGRIPSTDEEEAASDIDKLIKYVLNPDYGVWRNNAFFAADTGDDDMHQCQAENIVNLVSTTQNTGLEINKAYVDMFPRAVNETAISEDSRTSSEARRQLAELLERGQFYGTYVGHAGYRNLTKSRMWSSTDAQNTTYTHLPIMMTACCDVARYDSDVRGICEYMFHNPDGGAIALLTSSREVYASSNHQLNQAWTKYLFSYATDGTIPTLGYAYMKAKQSFGSTSSSANKLKYVLLGDPAMQVAYPRPLFNITQVNGTTVNDSTTVTVRPLQQITVKAQVLNTAGTAVDTEFTGDATLTIYDKSTLLKTATYNNAAVSIYYPRDILAQVQGRVENGEFTGVAVLPRYCRAVNEGGMIRVYAHKDNTDLMVNGEWDGLKIGSYNESTAQSDTEPPVVASMYLNDESNTDGAVVPASSTLYITATDNLALNNQTLSLGNNMRLVLDGNTSYSLIGKNGTLTDEGRQLDIAFPLTDLTEGAHSLAYTVHDVAGNATTRTISFVVAPTGEVALDVEELPATSQATITASTTLTAMPSVALKVTDALGNLVWTSTTTSFPATWDLKDSNGKAVDGGVYKVYGSYDNGTTYGGTNIATILVAKPLAQ